MNKKVDNKGNTGIDNSGYRNSGNDNSGNSNSGNRNSGNYNSGNRNSGNSNSGNWNSGNSNSSNYNSGNRNSGYWNSGNSNSGHWNSGNYNSGCFNTDEPNIRLFNKDTNLKRSEIVFPHIECNITEWIEESKMTDAQKKEDPNFSVKGGTLIKREYKEAWKIGWSKASEETKKQFQALPNFDADIFLEITGIDVRKSDSCSGKIVIIDGKKYKLTEV